MYCPVHKTKMIELFTSSICEQCTPATAEIAQPSPGTKLAGDSISSGVTFVDCTYKVQRIPQTTAKL